MSDQFECPECQELLDYDPQGAACEKCEWWIEEERKEHERYERLQWEREQEARERWEWEHGS